MPIVKAHHRIITPECRKRGDEVCVLEALETVGNKARELLRHWTPESGVKVHLKVEVEYPDSDMPR